MKTSLFFLFFLGLTSTTFSQVEPRLVLPVGHSNSIQSVVLSSDGNYVLTESFRQVGIYEAKSGKEIYFFDGINPVFDKNSKSVFYCLDSSIFQLEIENGLSTKLIKLDDWYAEISLSYNGDELSVLTNHKLFTIKLLNKGVREILDLDTITHFTARNPKMSHDNEYCTIVIEEFIHLVNLKTNDFKKICSTNDFSLDDYPANTSFFISPKSDRSFLFVSNPKDSTIKLHDLSLDSVTFDEKINGPIYCASVHPDLKKIIIVSDSLLSLDIETGKRITLYPLNKKYRAIEFDNRGSTFCLFNIAWEPWDTEFFRYSKDNVTRLIMDTTRIVNEISHVIFNPVYPTYITVESQSVYGNKFQIRTFSTDLGKEINEFSGGAVGERSVIYAEKGLIATNTVQENPVIWNFLDGKSIFQLDTTNFEYVYFQDDTLYGQSTVWPFEYDTLGIEKNMTWRVNPENGEILNCSIDKDNEQFATFSDEFKAKQKPFVKPVTINLTWNEGDTTMISHQDSSLYYFERKKNRSKNNFKLKSFLTLTGWIRSIKAISNEKVMVLTNKYFYVIDKKLEHIIESYSIGELNWRQHQHISIFVSPDEKKIIIEHINRDTITPILEFTFINRESKLTKFIKTSIITQHFDFEFTKESDKIFGFYALGGYSTFFLDATSGNELFEFPGTYRLVDYNRKLFVTTKFREIYISDLNSGNIIHNLKIDIRYPYCFGIPNTEYMLVEGDNKTILVNIVTGKILYTRIQLTGLDWLAYDTNYRFDGTPGAIEKLYFVCGLEVVDLNQVKDSLYVPNLVQRIMNGENLDHLPKLSDLNICGVTPLVEPIEEGNGKYRYQITPRSGGVGDIEVYLNGVVRQKENAKNLILTEGKYLIEVDPELIKRYQVPSERLNVKVIAKTANNSISSRGVVLELEQEESSEYRKPSLHALMIGVDDYKDNNLDLNYAAKDANDLHRALEQSAKKLFNIDDTNRVFFYNLTVDRNAKIGTSGIKGETPDRPNILKTLEEIEKKSKPEDILLLFFAGHGEIVDKDQLLLLTTESTTSQFQGIRMRELLEQLNKIPAGKRVLILDACHSGAAINNMDLAQLTGKRDVKDAERQSQRLKELDKLASKSGFAIITASSSDQKALELPQYEHGLMTYALLNAMLNNKNSLDENNQLQLDKWLLATEEEVKKLNLNQSAERMVPVSFPIGKIDEEVRSSIVLKEIPTVFVNNVINFDLGYDDREIKQKLLNHFFEKSRSAEKTMFVTDTQQPGSLQVNLVYTVDKGDISLKLTLLKNNEVVKQVPANSTVSQLQTTLNELIQAIEEELK
jgi:hypothetical protein